MSENTSGLLLENFRIENVSESLLIKKLKSLSSEESTKFINSKDARAYFKKVLSRK